MKLKAILLISITSSVTSSFQIFNNILVSEHTNLSDKLNALNYFETIIRNSNVANRLVNSAFMNLLLKFLTQVKNIKIRIRVCSIIGQLVRHATVIDNDLAELNISNIFVNVLLKDKNESLRRKAIASFGEFLFYSAT
jgi:serine/threonine-protein kinase ULK4